MKITDAKVIVTCPGRNFVTLKIFTDQGLTGIGDATLNGRELSVASYLKDHVVPCLIGKDARKIEDIWQYLYKGAYWRRGPVTMSAIAAVDTALWDIKAKAANMPLYDLLGGKCRDGVMVYGHANGAVSSTYGVSKDKMYYEPADAALPSENIWSTRKYLNFVPKLFQEVRSQIGYEHHLLHDVHHRLTPIEAGRLGRMLEEFHLFWMEDPTPAENQEAFRLIRQHTVTPIAVGEIFNTIYDCCKLIQEQLIDYIRMTVVHSGGISHLRKIAQLAELYQVKTGSHGATDLSPVCMGAALHFDISISNFGIQEYMRHTKETDDVFPHSYSFKDGYLTPGDKPGHGVEINEELAKKYPYKPAFLPVNRLEDGSMFNW